MEGGSNMLAFGDNTNGICPVTMMPFMTSNHHHHHHHRLHLPPPANINQDQNNNTIVVETHHNMSSGNVNHTGYYFMDSNTSSSSSSSSIKDKIISHPYYHRLLAAYINCQKVGAPPEVVARLEEACASAAATMGQTSGSGCLGDDPALDQFMEAYCEMLTKYEEELSKPFKDAMVFLDKIESQFKALAISSDSACSEAVDRNGSPEDDEVDISNGFVDPSAEDRELKGQLLRKYSGYIGSLKQEFMKKKKKGKLPKEARQQLLEWWSRHYKWPYPSESQKLALAESTGLDQKQINNWFINQRKRHWKPTEDMQFMVMDAAQPHYFMDTMMGNPFPMDLSPTLL